MKLEQTAPKGKHRTGRPKGGGLSAQEKQATWEAFVAAIREGDTTRKALRRAGLAWSSVSRWIEVDEEKAAQLLAARRDSSALWADRAVEEVEGASPATAYLARIRADTYKWRAAVQAPREWSERQSPEVQVNVGLDIATLHLEMLRHINLDAVEPREAKPVLDRPAE